MKISVNFLEVHQLHFNQMIHVLPTNLDETVSTVSDYDKTLNNTSSHSESDDEGEDQYSSVSLKECAFLSEPLYAGS